MEYTWKRDGFTREILYRIGSLMSNHSKGIYTAVIITGSIVVIGGLSLYFSSKTQPVIAKEIQREYKPSPLEEDINLKELPVSP